MAVDFLAKRDIIEQIIPNDLPSVNRASGVSGAWSAYATLITAANLATLCPGGFILCGAYTWENFQLIGTDGYQYGLVNVQVATGVAGSEVPVAEGHGVLFLNPGNSTTTVYGSTGRTVFFEPVLIPTNLKIAFRASATSALAVLVSMYIFGYDARYFANPIKAVEELRYIRGLCSPTQGATVWPSPGTTALTTHATTAWLYGTPVAFNLGGAGGVALTPLLITGLVGVSVTLSNRVQAKIGIGASGSEQWMSKVGLPTYVTMAGPFADCYLPRPLYVKTGETVSVVIAGSLVNTVTNIALKGYTLK